ncbi:hypothetical protein [Fontibacter flavus]|uniref:Uncharacterized protein n=1 Tax=Fontibacter flavus TaxID=654838 RepID=A0ABV6FPK1_9BACT
MKTTTIISFGLILLFLILPTLILKAQETQSEPILVRIKTKDGNEFIGEVFTEDDQKIILITEKFGEISIQKIDIQSREIISAARIKDGKLWFENPQSTRYFFAPNGYGIKRGEAYYQNVWIFFNQFTFGVSDNFSFSVGTVPLFLFAGASTPVWVNPKVSIPIVKDKYNLGAGALVGTVIGEGGAFGILYGVNTFGNKDQNITLGLGWGFADGGIANSPTITISGMTRVGPRGYLLTENYILNTGSDTFGLISFGGRSIIGEVGLDYGLAFPVTGYSDSFVAVPWLGLTVPIGKNKSN